MAFDSRKFIARFVEEAREHLESLNRGLVEFEKNPDDAENLNSIFRSAHTIKGSSRMLKLTAVTAMAHRLEDVLGALREKRIVHTRDLSNLMFRGTDALSAMVEKISGGEEADADHPALSEALQKAAEGAPLKMPEGEGGASDRPAEEAGSDTPAASSGKTAPPERKIFASTESVRVDSGKLDDLIRLMGEVVSHQNRLKQRVLDLAGIEIEAKGHVESLEREGGGETLAGAASLQGELKRLLALLRQDKTMQDILTAEFQEKALLMRMVPVSKIFGPLHRQMRDMASGLGKNVDFNVVGGEIELDRKMMEKLTDPLLHMLRNSLDHGIETTEVRKSRGKPPRGRIDLSARYDAGTILIEIRDDGAGISTEKIKEKALAKKLFEAAALEEMTEDALLDLIFLPGFSTSGIITDISGRGVGMDVVKKNIVEGMRGSVVVETAEGRGSTFSLRLPMTLAIIRILLVTCRGMTFGITTHHVTEILRVGGDRIFDVTDRKALRLREEFIPVVELGDVMNIPGDASKGGESKLVVIARVGKERMGFAVDALLDEEDMVIKPLPGHMKNLKLVSGVTITGKNEIINILSVPALVDEARRPKKARIRQEPPAGRTREISILVVDDSVNTREIERDILESYGYKVTIAGDGVEALEKAAAAQYDLVITDVEMPLLDGFSLTERLRSESAYENVPIIIVTSREKEEDKMRGVEVGADAYIVKGAFDQSSLVATVQNLIGTGTVQ